MTVERIAPPCPGLSLCVGVSGHRNLAPKSAAPLARGIGAILDRISVYAAQIAGTEQGLFASGPPMLSLLSQLARGADQLAATEALTRDYALRAVLPFPREDFVEDFDQPGEREAFEALLARSDYWSLPGTRVRADLAYAMAGEATVAQSDLLIAIWDGKSARGLGGTGDVIDYAVRRGVPVLHLPTGKGEAMILWSGFDELPPALFHRDNVPRRPLTDETLDALLRLLLLPSQEENQLQTYFGERERRWRTRLEFPLLLALAGVRRMSRANFRSDPYPDKAAWDWTPYRPAADGNQPLAVAGFDRLELAFAWADGLADHFAQIYRSGVIFNFAAAALAVLLSLLGFLLPGGKVWLIAAELGLVAGLIVNTSVGTRNEWHRRWLDYRFLAEQLRTMRSLKLFSLASPRIELIGGGHEQQRWTHFYAAAIWRGLGVPPSIADEAALVGLAAHVAQHELDSQVAYHKVNAHRMHVLDHRLHKVGACLFYLTAGIGVVMLAGLLFDLEAIHAQMKWLSVLTAALPTIGSAVFGIRGAGDFAGAASRSSQTAGRLAEIAHRLRRAPLGLSDAARAAEEAATTMHRDLGEWRSAYQNRVLAIPA